MWFLSRMFLKFSAASFAGPVLTSRIASSITSSLTTCHPASCVVAILSNSKTTSVSSRMLKTTEKRKRKLGFHGLLRSTVPKSCLAIPGTLAFQDRVCHSVALCLLLKYVQYSYLVAIVSVARPMRSALLRIWVFLAKVGPVYLRPYIVDISGYDFCLVVMAVWFFKICHVVVQVHLVRMKDRHSANSCV